MQNSVSLSLLPASTPEEEKAQEKERAEVCDQKRETNPYSSTPKVFNPRLKSVCPWIKL